jgi:hypothetical protein
VLEWSWSLAWIGDDGVSQLREPALLPSSPSALSVVDLRLALARALASLVVDLRLGFRLAFEERPSEGLGIGRRARGCAIWPLVLP